jgi:hypothetical protein
MRRIGMAILNDDHASKWKSVICEEGVESAFEQIRSAAARQNRCDAGTAAADKM